ncbi:MAG: RagB/SusD family nutrient uptake outer membrane protein, partial [Bacteroidota bacterium]|nr:RagB/SusD family nutrient uptake outer membrane protein [Bacteroidota bacterium]
MKNFKITNISKVVVVLMTILTFTVSCTFDEEFDPNRPSLEGVLTDASENQLNNLVVGVESGMRGGV